MTNTIGPLIARLVIFLENCIEYGEGRTLGGLGCGKMHHLQPGVPAAQLFDGMDSQLRLAHTARAHKQKI